MATKNIVPNADSEGGIGTSSKYWATGFIDAITTTGNLVIGGSTVSTGKITADAGIDIDNINIDGTTIALSSGDLTIDVAADIILDAAGGDVVLNAPGLISAAANNAAMTVGDNFAANVMFHQSALELAVRAPAVPGGDDAAIDAMMVQDPHSGLVFEVRVYKGYRKQMIEVAATWGVKAWKSENMAILLG